MLAGRRVQTVGQLSTGRYIERRIHGCCHLQRFLKSKDGKWSNLAILCRLTLHSHMHSCQLECGVDSRLS